MQRSYLERMDIGGRTAGGGLGESCFLGFITSDESYFGV